MEEVQVQSEINDLSPAILKLLEKIDKNNQAAEEKNQQTATVEVSRLVKSAASLYERIRSTIDFKEEHLLRRGAISRILWRKMNFNPQNQQIAQSLILELIESGYLKNESIDLVDIETISQIITKYIELTKKLDTYYKKYFLTIAAAEIEERFVDHSQEEILFTSLNKIITQDIRRLADKDLDELQLSLALRKLFLKADRPALRYYVWRQYYPSLVKINDEEVTSCRRQVVKVIESIESIISNPQNKQLAKQIKRYNPIFITLENIISENSQDLPAIFSDPDQLKSKIRKFVSSYHTGINVKLARSIKRTVLFILVTKIVVGVMLELPYDIYFFHEVDWLPLSINIIFPPLLMFASAALVNIPGPNNTEKLIKEIFRIVYAKDANSITQTQLKLTPSTPMHLTIRLLFTTISLGIYALLIWLLNSLGFNLISGVLFFLFLSIVSFLVFRIRSTANELLVVRDKEGIFYHIIDFIFLPFMRIGYWLASKLEGYNIFLFFLDFIIEAPFKLVLEVLGNWLAFVREKKEEIIP